MLVNRGRFSWLIALALLGGLFGASAPAAANLKHRQVLILHSYHHGMPWTDGVMEGMHDLLSTFQENTYFNVEYLDTMRYPGVEYFNHIVDAILHYKLENRSFDLVMVSDNEAFNFVMGHREDLFKDTPIIFCGIDKFDPSSLAGISGVTGVVEPLAYRALIQQALALFPETKEFVIVGSTRNLTGNLDFQLAQQAAAEFSTQARFTYLNDLKAGLLDVRLQMLRPGQVVIINGQINDDEGHLLSFVEQARLFRESCTVPVFSPWDAYLGQGIVGGQLISSRQQGLLAAELALEIFAGASPDKLPVRFPPLSNPVFDYRQLQRFGLSKEQLPAKSELINEPSRFYQLSRQQALIFTLALVGSLTVSLLMLTNILRRKKAESRLRESEQSYRLLSQQFQIILDGIPDGLTLISKEMKVVWSNQGAGSYFNKQLGSVPGEYCCKVLYNRTAICDHCPAVKAFASGKNEEATIVTAGGQTLEVKAFPIKEASGEIINVIMHAADITEKSRLREESIRTSRLASLGELAAGVAHEINNPNALIMYNADLLSKCYRDSEPILQNFFMQHGDFSLGGINYTEMRFELSHLFDEIFDGAKRIKRIVDDLKNFVRQEDLELTERVNMNEVVMAAIRLISSSIKKSTDLFKVDYAEVLPPFCGSFQRTEQVVINLIMNACQSLPSKDSSVLVTTWYEPETQKIVLRVSDQGVGIPAKDLPHIMEPFFTTKREHGGTGLGLSVTSRIVQEHKGSIDFQSVPGLGTTVSMYFPVAAEEIFHE